MREGQASWTNSWWQQRFGGWRSLSALLLGGLLLLTLACYALSPFFALVIVLGLLGGLFATRHASLLMLIAFVLMPIQMPILGEEGSFVLCGVDVFLTLLALAALFLCLRRGRFVIGPASVPFACFFGVALASTVMLWHGSSTAIALFRLLRGSLLPLLIFANLDVPLTTLRRTMEAYLIGINIMSVLSLLAFAQGGIGAAMYTQGIHKNALGPLYGCGLAIVLILLLTESNTGRRRAWLYATLAGASLGLLFTLSRGGWFATGAGILLVVAATRRFKAFFLSLLVVLPLLLIAWKLLPESSTRYATNISADAETVRSRLDAIDKTMTIFRSSPIYGAGIDLNYVIDPHNVLILTLGETGVIGLAAFLFLMAGGFANCRAAFRAARDSLPGQQIAIMGASLLLISLVSGCMDIYWRRGAGVLGWASVGLAVNVLRMAKMGKLHDR